jgi:hypothetical protein
MRGSQGETKIGGTSETDERSRNMLSRSAMGMTGRWVTVLLMITAWIFLSNHCALALSRTSMDSETGGCPMHSAPNKEKPAAHIPCCKELRAVAAHAPKSVTAAARQLVCTQDYVAAILMAPPRVTLQMVLRNTGPPRALSFAESILQHSVLVHAPPAVFARV